MPKKVTPSIKKVIAKKLPAKKVAIKKEVAKKVIGKKVVAKKTTTKKVTKTSASLVYADNDRSFWLNDGQILNSLMALKEALAKMDENVFFHHVNEEKNDFADWVDAVLGDSECAATLRKVKSPKNAHVAVSKRLTVYQL